jgi:hypothetical protein
VIFSWEEKRAKPEKDSLNVAGDPEDGGIFESMRAFAGCGSRSDQADGEISTFEPFVKAIEVVTVSTSVLDA